MAGASYDVVIVGGGPAGSTLAYRLATAGVSVAVVERRVNGMPLKPCGGGIEGVFMTHLPPGMSVEEVVEDRIEETTFAFRGRVVAQEPMPGPFYMTQRSRLDAHLLRQAEAVGAKVYQGERAVEFYHAGHQWFTNTTTAGTLRSRVLVGADGAYSQVARQLGMRRDTVDFVAAEWDVVDLEASQEYAGSVLVDADVSPLGYFWVFPKANHVNMGWGLPRKKAKGIHGRVLETMRRYGIAGPRTRHAHHIPFARSPESVEVVKGTALLVGDAAGVADPATGAGIGPGVWSSDLAAYCITRAMASGPVEEGLGRYRERMQEGLFPEMQAAGALRNVMVLSLALRGQMPMGCFGHVLKVMGGRTTYCAWARQHPNLYRLGRLVQRAVDRMV